jgi:predicted nucleotidyltransferase
MDKSTIIASLRDHEAELRAAGIERLFLFGSYARGTAVSERSDVDLMAEFDGSKQLSLLEMVHIQNRIADILGANVDLAPTKSLKDPVRARAAREAVLAF